jgi:dTMP kinase
MTMGSAKKGRFIVLEGIDGCGSTTQAKRLIDALKAKGLDARLTWEPSTGVVGRLIREILKQGFTEVHGERAHDWATMALLFAADRMEHVDSVILPAVAEGAIVVSDRYDLSSVAYQSATASGGAAVVPWIRELNRHSVRPDLTLVLDIDADLAEERRKGRGGVPEIYEHTELQRRLAAIYLRAEALVPGDRLHHIDASGTPDEVQDRIAGLVSGILA